MKIPRNFTNSQRLLILRRANYKCLGCGTTLDATVFEADHRIAYAKGGATLAWNAQALCRNCNRRKSDNPQ